MKGIDWSGNLLGRTTAYSMEVPVIDKKTKEYALLALAIRQIEIALKPATPREIVMMLSKLRLHFLGAVMTEEESAILLDDYVKDLSTYPSDIIEQACIIYRRSPDSLFFPKIGQLLEYANDLWYPRKAKLMKLKKLQEVSNNKGMDDP